MGTSMRWLTCALGVLGSAPLRAQEPVATAPPPAQGEELRWYWRNGLRFSSADKAFDFRLGGQIQFDANWIGNEAALEAAQPGSTEDGTEFRRLRLSLEGTLYEDWFFKFQPDFTGGQVRLTDAYLGHKDVFDGLFDARVGQFKEPLGQEELLSTKNLTFLEKALPIEAFAPTRNDGVAAFGSLAEDAAIWSLGVFRADTDEFGFSQEDGGGAITGRIGGTPVWSDGGERLLFLGGAYSFRDEEDVRFRTRPEVHLSSRFVDTGTIASEDIAIGGVELAAAWGPVHATAEYLRVDVDGAGDPSFDGWYAQLGWFLTGETRPFRRDTGTWDRVKPKGGGGAYELAARLSAVDLDDGAVAGGSEENLTLGVNWYANPNVRVGVNYVLADIDAPAVDESLHALLMRFQVDW